MNPFQKGTFFKLQKFFLARRKCALQLIRIFLMASGGAMALFVLSFCRPSHRPNVILISIDTLRPDHLSCYGYNRQTSPTIDRLAAEGVRFAHAFSSTTWTLPAHLALLTGLPDLVHGTISEAKKLDENRITLAEVLKKNGYRTWGIFTAPFLLPRWGFSQGFDLYHDATLFDKSLDGPEMLSASERGRTTPGALDKVEELLSEDSNSPFFLFLHLFDVHPDFDPPPPYDRMFDPDYSGTLDGRNILNNPAVRNDMDQRDLDHLIALYDGEIRFVDEAGIRRLLQVLESKGLAEQTLLVITSDHGEEFFEHGVFGHRQNLFDTTLRIPLVLWGPGLIPSGLVIDEPARIIDIMPTILDLLGLEQSPESLGESLVPLFLGPGQNPTVRPVFCEVQTKEIYLEGLRTDRDKFIRDFKNDLRIYFDLVEDPAEKIPVEDPENEAFRRAMDRFLSLRWDLVSYRDSLSWSATEAPRLDPELRERLKSLGYIKDEKEKKKN